MKNTMKKYGFIALIMVVAVIAIGFTACEVPEEWEVTIELQNDTQPIAGNAKLIATTDSAKPFASIQWYKDDAVIPNATFPTYEVPAAGHGVYSVKAKIGSDEKDASIKIFHNDVLKYIGTWKMTGSTAGSTWTTPYGNADEILVITATKFRIDSTYSATPTGPKEYFEFNITDWSPATGGADNFNRYGFKLTGSTTAELGYGSFTNFFLFTQAADSNRIRRFNVNGQATPPIARSYVRQ
jgi:hypothetical protein